MREIQMVDLRAQYENLKDEIDRAIQAVLQSTAFIKGPEVGMFEDELKEYSGARHVVSCANGTDALQIAMMSLGLNHGDEVITTNFTFVATIEVLALLGLKPVIVDPDPGTFNISPDSIRKAITPRTRAIIPVHLFGQCADMESILSIAAGHNLFVVEDAAQATGARFIFSNGNVKKAGTIGTIGTTSFFPSKNLGCYGDGGALFTDDDELAGKIRSIANHGMKIRYHYNYVGINSRLDTLQAAILRVKLRHLDSYNEARRHAADYYDKAFKECQDIMVPLRSSFSSHIFHQYTLKVKGGKRDELKRYLGERGIPSMIYYPGPLHMQNAYRYLGYGENDFPVTNSLCREVLSLPVHTEMDREQLEYITGCVLEFFNNN
ncbi:MAG TPA: DegT/DnrJ/EryC1/StrS family aminotransferase [Bacteroidales bacterium]|jgi:dTDP-4-amino-4,6-dideoxygalactose transaminase|nr:aminotransferase class I/II-fold pyridoxal phosphate-dependent enzyme [Bacteroidales bacterium]HNR40917.1 DegT/DnrJ/EryC1/StrS family aminotransferase [Bacteroidales bacterium]HPM18037.1 DegT/DnrJ/EryC1/StrS family aminotransferase [Bacteroidales bacterium]HQG76537.1 DegT/DnrJ/EryC1/StrS family aminotransferase [Bacteroidales bacterium]